MTLTVIPFSLSKTSPLEQLEYTLIKNNGKDGAAVEAARVGPHGKGFAVIAEEVRNLAAKIADAAKNTGEPIDRNVYRKV